MNFETLRYCLKLYFAPITGAWRGIRAEYRQLASERPAQR